MATILEGAVWTLTDAAAERMVENGLIKKCDGKHDAAHHDLLAVDAPIYHISGSAPGWFGVHSIPDAIITAEAHVETDEEPTDA